MAIKRSGMVKTVIGNENLSLTPTVGEAYRIRGIFIKNPATDYVTLSTAKTTVGYFRVGGTQGNHLFAYEADKPYDNLFTQMIKAGVWHEYPVAEGETFIISGASGNNAVQVVIYDVYDAGDVRNTEINGSASQEYDYIAYGTPSDVQTKTVAQYDTATTPEEFPRFPFNVQLGGNSTFEIRGVVMSPISYQDSGATGIQLTKRLKFVKDRVILFDEDKEGIPVYATDTAPSAGTYSYDGVSSFGSASDKNPSPLVLFEEPLKFNGGEELDIYVETETVTGSAVLQPSDVEIGFISHVKVG